MSLRGLAGAQGVACALLALTLASCGDSTSPSRRGGSIALSPQFSPAALEAFQIVNVDGVRVDVFRGQERIAGQQVDVAVDADEIRLTVTAPLQQPVESLDVGLALLGGGTPLFAGGRRLEFRSDGLGSPQTIPMIYLLGGITSLDLQPLDTVLTTLESLLLRLVARDASGAAISLFYATFTSSDPLVATVGPLGTVLATGLRGQTTIQAIAPGDMRSSIVVRVVPLPLPLEKLAGDLQSLLPGLALPMPFVVRVLGTDNQPLVGVPVRWTSTTAGGLVVPPISLTDASGAARALGTVGLTPGPYAFTANYRNQTTQFVATAAGALPTLILEKISGDLQSVLPGLTLPAPFIVRVLADGQPVANGAVQWVANTPGAVVLPPISLTDANGLAQTIATVGLIPQSYNFVATYQGQSVPFAATAAGTPPPPPPPIITLQKVAGDLQRALPGTPLANPFAVRVLSDNQPLAGVPVSWAATTVGGIILPSISLTDANGIAQAVGTLGLLPQLYTFTAAYQSQSVPFVATAASLGVSR